jgi:hypothetical protein
MAYWNVREQKLGKNYTGRKNKEFGSRYRHKDISAK